MWFKNLQLFRLPAPWQISSEALDYIYQLRDAVNAARKEMAE